MDSIFEMDRRFRAQLRYIVPVPLFFICCCFVYNPFGIREMFEGAGGLGHAFHYLMLFCIHLAVLALSRLIFWALYRHGEFRWWQYIAWCMGEVIVFSFFTALYLSLFKRGSLPYFPALSITLKYSFLILVFPYTFLILTQVISNSRKEIQKFSGRAAPEQDSLVRLYDEHQRLKLTINPSALLYVCAETNYVKIHYLEAGRHRDFLLRTSMKRIESAMQDGALVRCHRSYFVNPRHIKVLRKSSDGCIAAELSIEGLQDVPVSRQNYDKLASLL